MRELAWEGLGDPKESSASWGILEDPGGQSYQSYQSDQSYQSTLYVFWVSVLLSAHGYRIASSMHDVFFVLQHPYDCFNIYMGGHLYTE